MDRPRAAQEGMMKAFEGKTVRELAKTGYDGEDTIFYQCTFIDATLEGANMSGATFIKCVLTRVDFYWGQFFRTSFLECVLDDVDFRGANLGQASFVDSKLVRCNFGMDNLGAGTDTSDALFIHSVTMKCLGIQNTN